MKKTIFIFLLSIFYTFIYAQPFDGDNDQTFNPADSIWDVFYF